MRYIFKTGAFGRILERSGDFYFDACNQERATEEIILRLRQSIRNHIVTPAEQEAEERRRDSVQDALSHGEG